MPRRSRPQAKRRWKTEELEDFVSQFGYLFSPEELREIEACWGEKCWNAFILGIYDRHERGPKEREELIR
jgi:hypothetical protein